jgi:6-phosphogluconolactonase (cycloisomerase 2 family)
MRLGVWLIVAAVLSLTGCGDFFRPEPKAANSGGGGGGGTTGNRAYVINATANNVAGFTVGTGTLTAVPNSPLALLYAPAAAVTMPDNSFLYVAGPGAIYVYTINADGSLTGATGGAAVAIVNVSSIDISPDGNWLFALDLTSTVIDQFKINRTTGALSSVASTPYSVTNAVVVPRDIRVAPSGSFVFIALGTGGDLAFSFNTTSGVLAQVAQISLNSATTSDNALTVDSATTFLYIARSGTNGGVAVYGIGAGGVLNQISGSPFAAGSRPISLVIDKTGAFIYAANQVDNTISGYTIGTGGALSALNGSPYASGTQVGSLGADSSGKYILAAAFGGSPDLSMYGFDAATPGKLNLVTSAATGTAPTGAIGVAMTH